MLNAAITRLRRELQGRTHAAVAVNLGRPNAHTSVVSVTTDEREQTEPVTVFPPPVEPADEA